MAIKKNVRVAAREAMQRFNYCPLEVLVHFAQDPSATNDSKMRIAETLLPYMYPKLSNMTLEGEVNVSQNQESQAALLRRILEDPDLADAAQKLSIASSMMFLESEEVSGSVQ